MKKNLLLNICYILLAITFCSCEVQDREKVIPDTISETLVLEVMALPSGYFSLGYSKLKPEEKVLLWNKHLDSFTDNDNQSAKLKAHIKKLKQILNVELYTIPRSKKTEELIKNLEQEWFNKPIEQGLFTKDELLEIATSFGITKINESNYSSNNLSQSSSEVNAIAASCSCRYTLSCPGSSSSCETGGCSGGEDCGILGTSKCTGRCTTDKIEPEVLE